MKNLVSLVVAACVFGAAGSELSLNGSWQFRFDEGKSIEQVADPAFAATDVMTVPGCYDTMPKWRLKRGTGLYRKTFTLERPVENAWLTVDGIGLRGDFRIDGRSLGVWPYPYARLELPTGPLAAGEHTVFMALDNRFDWSTLKLARMYYDFYFYGGIYRGVSLSFDNRRLFVRTRDFRTGTVEVEAVNFAARDFDATLVFDGTHEVKATFRDARATVRVPDFRLWSPESPNLHTVTIRQPDNPNGRTAERFPSARFGIRTIEARDRHVWLNGKKVFLQGVNRHDQHIEFGVTVSEAQMVRDLQLIKGMGANFIRGAHYQQSQRFLDLCDEIGILVWEESLGWGNGQGYTRRDGISEFQDPAFGDQLVFETREMVRTSFNHPSVVIFAFLNECNSPSKDCKAVIDRLIAAIRAEDSGRLVSFACNRWNGDLGHEKTDIVAVNSYPGVIPMYPGTRAELAERTRSLPSGGFDVIAKYFREKYPDKPIMVSEGGMGADYGVHDPEASVGSEEFQVEYVGDVCEAIWSNPDYVGFAMWEFADNRTYHRNSNLEPGKRHGIAKGGVFTPDRKPKLVAGTLTEFFRHRTPASMK